MVYNVICGEYLLLCRCKSVANSSYYPRTLWPWCIFKSTDCLFELAPNGLGENDLMFCIGDMIAHPMHGAGVIDSIEERKMNGCTRLYYILKMPAGGMVVMIPTESTEQIGVRPIVDSAEADELMASIPTIDAEMTSNWNRRYRENMQRLKSGDLVEVARVVKGLMTRDVEKGLSTGERKMLHSAKQILISELVLSKKLTYEEVESRINASLA